MALNVCKLFISMQYLQLQVVNICKISLTSNTDKFSLLTFKFSTYNCTVVPASQPVMQSRDNQPRQDDERSQVENSIGMHVS